MGDSDVEAGLKDGEDRGGRGPRGGTPGSELSR
jgi:hypothetical protein